LRRITAWPDRILRHSELFFAGAGEPRTESVDRKRADLADLDPRALPEARHDLRDVESATARDALPNPIGERFFGQAAIGEGDKRGHDFRLGG
jgi:hypothetical protein